MRGSLSGRRFDSAAAVVVLDGDRLAGIVTLEALLAARADIAVDAIMDGDPPVLEPDCDQERAAWAMVAARGVRARPHGCRWALRGPSAA